MTTIRSAFGKRLQVKDRGADKVVLTCDDDHGSIAHVRVYQRAELRSAIGQDTPYAELVEQLHAATQRAEAAEAEALEQASLVRTFADRAEAAEAKLANSEPRALCNELREKLAEANRRRHNAEATIQRIANLVRVPGSEAWVVRCIRELLGAEDA
jgi:hypothetical protein